MYQYHSQQQQQHAQQGPHGAVAQHQPPTFIPSAASNNSRPRGSAAIPIVAPPPGAPTAIEPTSTAAPVQKKPCRNVAIYGHCKYENEGCPFEHGSTSPTATTSMASATATASASSATPSASSISSPIKGKPGLTGPSLPSSPLRGALSAKNAGAAVFVPKGPATPNASASSAAPTLQSDAEDVSSGMHDMNLGAQSMGSAQVGGALSGRGTPNSFPAGAEGDHMNSYGTTYAGTIGGQDPSMMGIPQTGPQTPRPYNPYEHMADYGDPGGGPSGPGLGLGGAMDFYGASAAAKIRQPLHYHLYAPPLPHVSNLHPHHLSAHAFFLSPNQREELQRKQEAMHATAPPPELGGPTLPEELHVYHSLVPLEHAGPGAPSSVGLPPGLVDPRMGAPGASGATGATGDPSKVFGYRTHVYKAICTLDGKRYVLRRLEGFRLQHEQAISLVERWRRIRHPSIVSVREAFTTRAFGDQSIVFVYDYHPLSTTLYSEHMTTKPPQPDRRTGRLQPVQMQVAERVLWSYLCQLASVIRCIHASGMAARCIEPSKVLRTAKNRVRLNCCSIFDVIAYDPEAEVGAVRAQQEEDLVNLGKLMLSLCLNSMTALANVPKSMENVGQRYSAELKDVISWLLEPAKEGSKTADELGKKLGNHVADELDSSLNYNDLLENSLMKELENGRLVRLLCKFGFINERPEFDHDPRWAETGDRYIIKLFRDYVFHAVDEAGRPVVDLSHILTNLNKLDAGVDEKIMLTSRDEQSCLVVSYREIKNCVENAFQDLSRTR